jgi:dihydroxy-acid dehydratase
MIRIDLNAGRCDMLVPAAEIEQRKQAGVPAIPASATPWQEIYRATVGQLESGAVLETALKYRSVASKTPRHNH